MKKILLIDDRSKRQKDLLGNANVNVVSFNKILDNKIDDEYILFLKLMEDNTFILSDYEVIIAHQSIFESNEKKDLFNKFKTHCKENNCSLVLFSGGNNNAYINEEYEELSLSSFDFYSQNLVLFLEEFEKGNKNILILSYGRKWKLNIILNTLEKVTFFLDKYFNDEDIDFDEFRNFIKYDLLENLHMDFYKMEVEDNWICIEEIIKLKSNMIEHIKDMADE